MDDGRTRRFPPWPPTLQPRIRAALLALSIAIVLADSSVVTIALPEILAQYEVEVPTLSWALTSFSLALAAATLPPRTRRAGDSAAVFACGGVVFAGASLWCALAPSFDVLVAARTVQGVAGAAVVAGALDLLVAATGSEEVAGRRWALAGIVGAAVGPAAGGVLTQLVGWEAIFVVQAPLVLLALAAASGVQPAVPTAPAQRPTSPSSRPCCSSRPRSWRRSSSSSCCSSTAGASSRSRQASR